MKIFWRNLSRRYRKPWTGSPTCPRASGPQMTILAIPQQQVQMPGVHEGGLQWVYGSMGIRIMGSFITVQWWNFCNVHCSLKSAVAVVAITAQNHGEVTGYGGKLTWIMVSFTRAFKGIESWQTRYFPLVMMASISLSAWNDAIFHKPKASFSTSQFSFAHKST